ncbi:hypothetical protein [Erythrobacter sp. EC-HK427]|uniref:hypothetical protein n=1 Tax=Erythrobacter sp. EC-HK427 TaxID=2038396 RepID=UPI0012596BD3|nr:hypothetical protein [Erythrobacter sp. EC-HK427]VVS98749.1 conserved membrane hypothetical protein [Erythrobacter sp. EC-HK427]
MASSPAQQFVKENGFYRRVGLGLAGFALAAFAIVNIGGYTNIFAMPRATHIHAIVMVAWVALFAVQNIIGAGANIALHRKLGWAGIVLATAVIITGLATQIATLSAGRVPPIFDPGYFLALGVVNMTLFGGFITAAIINRKRTDWHRRLMLGSFIVFLEPVLGRAMLVITTLAGMDNSPGATPPPPIVIEMLRFVPHLLIVGAIVLRDRTIRGSVHPALWWVLAAVLVSYGATNLLGYSAPFQELAASLVP